ncbi:F-box/LRR-repeat protein 12-like [Porites lutea]|uniref:F-box/LRR-repeat protein 12-like n=1 Tax=Porites lutea TaxID=51062 RepID=UPI003CC6425F
MLTLSKGIPIVLSVVGLQGNRRQTHAGTEHTSVNGHNIFAPVFSLHEEVVLRIFSFLPLSDLIRVSRVCRWWYRLSFDRFLFKNVDLRPFATRLTDPVKIELLFTKRMASIVQCLDLSGFNISGETLRILASSCSQLRVLKLKSVTFTPGTKGKNIFPENLKVLDIRFSQGHPGVYRAIATSLENIRSLRLCDAFLYTLLQDGTLKTTIKNLKYLRELDLSHCHLLDDNTLSLFTSCSRLEALSVRKCFMLTGSFVNDFIQSCVHLKTLILDGISISDNTLQNIMWDRSNLAHLELGCCPLISSLALNLALNRITTIIHSLEYLGPCSNKDNKALDEETILELETGLSKRRACKLTLTWLNLRCSQLDITKEFSFYEDYQSQDFSSSEFTAEMMKYAPETLV